jgi:hypothetical protein
MTIPGNMASACCERSPIPKPMPSAYIGAVLGAKCGLGLIIHPIKKK